MIRGPLETRKGSAGSELPRGRWTVDGVVLYSLTCYYTAQTLMVPPAPRFPCQDACKVVLTELLVVSESGDARIITIMNGEKMRRMYDGSK